jgi:hypothetical protein
MSGMDVAVELVDAYLTMTGYFTMSEFDIQRKTDSGQYVTVTDVDMVAIRFPGDTLAADVHAQSDAEMLTLVDEALLLEDGMIDVIIGEVKQGEAVFNSGLKSHHALHSVLRRIAWLYETGVQPVIADLQQHGISRLPARGGGVIRTRLVAFGQASYTDVHTLNLAHILTQMSTFMGIYEDVLKPAQFSETVPAFLRLLAKTQIELKPTT